MTGCQFFGRLILLATFAASAVTQAAITITQSDGSYRTIANNTAPDFAFDVQNSNSVMVVALYRDNNVGAISGVRFGDGNGIGSGDVAPDMSYNNSRMTLYVFLSPSIASGLSFRADTTALGGYTGAIWELAGVDQDTGTFTVTTGTNSLTTDGTNQFVLSVGGRNGGGLAHDATSDIPLASVIGGANAPGSGTMLGGTIDATSTGTYDLSWTNASEGQINIAFEAIPEPSSALLSLLAAGLLLRRRRA